jgi:hypothetical protein
VTAERLEALAKAKANGTFGGGAATTNPANGWVGSRLLNAPTDDWEPAVAADPSAPYVYLLTTRYGTRRARLREAMSATVHRHDDVRRRWLDVE